MPSGASGPWRAEGDWPGPSAERSCLWVLRWEAEQTGMQTGMAGGTGGKLEGG